MYADQRKFKEAAVHLQVIHKYHPDDYTLLHELGQVQLQIVQEKEAQATYQQIRKLLEISNIEASEMIKDLKTLAQNQPKLQANINIIITTLHTSR